MRIRSHLASIIFLSLLISGLHAQSIEPRDCAEIRIQGEQTMRQFARLLNQITDSTFFPSERNDLIQNSFRDNNPGRIFFKASVIIEDDLAPIGSLDQNTGLNDKNAELYLHNLDVNYSKYGEETVFFSNLYFGPIQKREFIFFHIMFDSEFKGKLKDSPNRNYSKIKRVATIRVEKVRGQWKAYIQQINFYRPEFDFVANYVDTDCDGVVESEDKCPEEPGLVEHKGCPPEADWIDQPSDPDRDGLVSLEDKCPNQMGPWCNQGCPTSSTLSPIENTRQVLWHELNGEAGVDVLYDLIKNERGDIVLVGEIEVRKEKKNLYFAVFDPCKKTIVSQVVEGGKQNDGARKVIQLSSGDYAVAGYTESNGSRDAWLVFIENNSNPKSFIIGSDNTTEEFFDLLLAPNGTLFMTGQKNGHLWLLQTDLNGSIIDEKVYLESSYSMGSALTVSANGEIYITGFEMVGKQKGLLVLRYRPASNRLEKIYSKNGSTGSDIIIDREEKLLLTGTYHTTNRFREDILVVRLDLNGQSLWPEPKTFGSIGVDVGNAVFETAEGNYFIVGHSTSDKDGGRYEKLWANLLNKTGDPLWDTPLYFGGTRSDRAYAISQTEANSVIAAGYSESSYPSKESQKSSFWLVCIRAIK